MNLYKISLPPTLQDRVKCKSLFKYFRKNVVSFRFNLLIWLLEVSIFFKILIFFGFFYFFFSFILTVFFFSFLSLFLSFLCSFFHVNIRISFSYFLQDLSMFVLLSRGLRSLLIMHILQDTVNQLLSLESIFKNKVFAQTQDFCISLILCNLLCPNQGW